MKNIGYEKDSSSSGYERDSSSSVELDVARCEDYKLPLCKWFFSAGSVLFASKVG